MKTYQFVAATLPLAIAGADPGLVSRFVATEPGPAVSVQTAPSSEDVRASVPGLVILRGIDVASPTAEAPSELLAALAPTGA